MAASNLANSKKSIIKGYVLEGLLDHTAKMSANVTFDPPQGSVVHLNSDHEFEMGCANHQMPLILLRDADSYDVKQMSEDWEAFSPTGVNSAVVATAGVEIASAVFDSELTYAPNDLLKAGTSNTVSSTGGVLTNSSVTLFTSAVVGVVSRGVRTNAVTKRDELCFWPVYCPGTA